MIQYNIEGYRYTQVEFESDKSDKGLYEAEDDLGTSYYYRGSVKSNNVYFNGAYWQIIRINGDGSVRLLYNGTVADAQGGQKKIGKKAFNIIQNRPGYVGYKYGNIDGSTIEEIYTNENDSTMKTYLEEWYKTNIVDKNLEKYIADSGFCNDRTLSSQAENGDGIQTTGKNTYYGAYDRYRNLKNPTLLCPNQERDYFTTSTSEIENKSLTYPIGLITVDELAYAGMADNFMNKMSYVYSTDNYWTMSPSLFNAGTGTANGYRLNNVGLMDLWSAVSSGNSVHPVIDLSKDVEITGGIGTSSDPFVVKVT